MRKTILATCYLFLLLVANKNSFGASHSTLNASLQKNKGLQLGDNSLASGTDAIATGANSIAIGSNAIATGNNETKESIEQKLHENEERLREIREKEIEVDNINMEIEKLKNKHAIAAEADRRVKGVLKYKEELRVDWNKKLENYNTFYDESNVFFRDQEEKISILNSKLDGISNISKENITSQDGLQAAATRFKEEVERGTKLSLNVDFYKEYIENYYKALGDLRKNQLKKNISYSEEYNQRWNAGMGENIKNPYSFSSPNPYSPLPTPLPRQSWDLEFASFLYLGASLYNANRYNGKNEEIVLGRSNSYNTLDFSNVNIENKPTTIINLKNINTDLTSYDEWQNAVSNADKFKTIFRNYFNENNNPFLYNEDKLINSQQFDLTVDFYIKTNEVTYYQKMYEDTNELSWLDKKKKAIEELKDIQNQYSKIKYSDGSYWINDKFHTTFNGGRKKISQMLLKKIQLLRQD